MGGAEMMRNAAIAGLGGEGLSVAKAAGKGEDAKLKESCRQFEAVLWRDVLDKAMSPSFGGEQSTSDATGTYKYFMNSTLADAVSGVKGGFSNILHAQLANQANKQPKEKE